jgi:hypothetical protein
LKEIILFTNPHAFSQQEALNLWSRLVAGWANSLDNEGARTLMDGYPNRTTQMTPFTVLFWPNSLEPKPRCLGTSNGGYLSEWGHSSIGP